MSAGDGQGHEHGLGDGAAALVEAGVGDVQAGQLADQRLELEERLQAALAGLGLVGRVGGVELAAAGDGIDHGGDEVVVAAAAEEADGVVGRLVARGQLLHVLRQLDLASGPAARRAAGSAAARPGSAGTALDRGDADLRQHRLLVVGGVQDVGQANLPVRSRLQASANSTHRCTRAQLHLMPFRRDLLLVLLQRHQVVERRARLDLDLDHPALAVGVLGDRRSGSFEQLLVDRR